MTRRIAPGWHKLTREQVAAILADTRRQGLIAADYGVSRPYVSQIKSGLRLKVFVRESRR